MSAPQEIDYLIIGAGPAGLQLAYFFDRAERDYLVLDRFDRPGVFFEKFPRHGRLISINKIHTGYDDRESQLRYDWNSLLCDDDQVAFTQYSDKYFAETKLYARYLRDFAARFKLNIQYSTDVTRVTRDGDGYLVTDAAGRAYRCRCLVVATGLWNPYLPAIPGIELVETYHTMSIDPADFVNQRLLIIGKGNSAFETANHLTHVTRVTHLCSPHSIRLAWKTHFFGHLRAINNDFLDTYILKGQNSVLDASIDKIEQVDGEYRVSITFTHAEGQRAELAYDRVIACTGFRWDYSFFADDCQPERACEGRLPAMTSAWESVNLPNLFFAGTLMQIRDLHKTMSNVLHGFRFNCMSLANILMHRFDNRPLPRQELECCDEVLADKIIQRVSSNAGLMHQPGFLADVLVVSESEQRAYYYNNYAVDYIRESPFAEQDHYYVITMEYGDIEGDPLSVEREPDPSKAYNDAYLHPRIRRFRRGELIAEHHISESLENDWRIGEHPGERPLIRKMEFIGQEDATQFQQTHRAELLKFLQSQLAPVRADG